MTLSSLNLTHPLVVKEKIQETHDCFSFVLEIPSELKSKFTYKAGQFVTFFLQIAGEEVRRSYSLASAPSVDSHFKVSVKRVKGGKGSNFLIDQVLVGQKLATTPPAGIFILPPTITSETHFVFFAAGSGITPIFSLIKELLKTTKNKVSLLYGNRDENSILFHRELHELNHQFSDRFHFDYILSNPLKEYSGLKGRLRAEVVQQFLNSRSMVANQTHAYLCGPEGFMATAEAALELFGLKKEQIHQEAFSLPSAAAQKVTSAAPSLSDDAVYIGDKSAERVIPKKIEISLQGETHTIDYIDGTTVLESALEAQLSPPYSCMDGACMACVAKVTSGLVYQNDMGILTEDYIEGKECLTCQARPISNQVKINFDQF